jgi:hypothetical protein
MERMRQAGYFSGGLRAVDNQPGRLIRQGQRSSPADARGSAGENDCLADEVH